MGRDQEQRGGVRGEIEGDTESGVLGLIFGEAADERNLLKVP